MPNLTLTIDADLLRRARVRAAEDGTSVNAVVREYLAAYAGDVDTSEAGRAFVEFAHQTSSGSGPEGRTWTRDDLHDR